MKTCKICHKQNPDIVMIKKTCYICILQTWPPKTKKQYRIYENAVAIRLRLTTPIDNQKTALEIVRKVGLDNLLKMESIIKGEIVPHKPGYTFSRRLIDKLEDQS